MAVLTRQVHLAYADVRIDSNSPPQRLEVRIKASKTDPFRKGVAIYIGRTDDGLCPVAATLSYMIQRGSSQGPLFVFENGKYLTRVRFVAAMREALKEAGFDPSRYAGHSFRIGAATTAAQRGVQDSLIKTGECGLYGVCEDITGHIVWGGQDTSGTRQWRPGVVFIDIAGLMMVSMM